MTDSSIRNNLSMVTRMIWVQDDTATFEIGPLKEYLAAPMASALRRVLLSSLPGAAITSVRIDGVKHEFQDIEEVKEDVPEIVQNLKKVRLRSFTRHIVTISLDVSGECIVRAGDIRIPGTVEIVNPDAHIATLDNKNAHLSMEMTVGTGRGFVSAETLEQEGGPHPIGLIPVDATYSPVTHVQSSIESLEENLQKIILSITTDGAITPDEALRQAADILCRQFAVLTGKYERNHLDAIQTGIEIPESIYSMPISNLNVSKRLAGVLRRGGYRSVGQLLTMGKGDLRRIRYMGEKSFEELCDYIRSNGFLPDTKNMPS